MFSKNSSLKRTTMSVKNRTIDYERYNVNLKELLN